jgi:hypothetical protein
MKTILTSSFFSALIFLTLTLILTSCGDDKLKRVETLGEFRVLGITTTTPEVKVGTSSVEVAPIVSDTTGGGRSVTMKISGCLDPGVNLGANVNCNHDPNRFETTSSLNTNSLETSFGLFSGIGAKSVVTIPSTIHLNKKSRDQFNGVVYLIIYSFTVDGKEVKAFRRISVTNRSELNKSPEIENLLVNNSTFRHPSVGDLLRIDSNDPEDYEFENLDGTKESRKEVLDVSWYVSKGKVDVAKTEPDKSVKIKEVPSETSGDYLVIAILRDDRGGMSVKWGKTPN